LFALGVRAPLQTRLPRLGALAYNWGIALAALGLAVLANVALARHDAQIDLTRERVFTPSAQAEDVVQSLTQDVRLTTRYSEDDLHASSIFSTMHEAGHGLYERGGDASLDRSPLATGCSSALHESQSRLWENVVGRSLPFWRWFHPRVQQAFPDRLGDVSLEELHRAVNRTQRSFIRVDADETSYGLHIILRFELETALVSGELAVQDLPEAWNARFEELIGLEVPNDRLGVLQDSHWSSGSFGYFPTYLLGSVLSVQIAERARAQAAGLDALVVYADREHSANLAYITGFDPRFEEALLRMPAGSRWKLWVPPALAYGERGAGSKIPPNAVLVFDVELIAVRN